MSKWLIKNFFSLDGYLYWIEVLVLRYKYVNNYIFVKLSNDNWYSISRRKSCEKLFWDGELQAAKQS